MGVHIFITGEQDVMITSVRDALMCVAHGSNHANILTRHAYDVLRWAEQVLEAIHDDMSSSSYVNSQGDPIPRDVGTFSQLQDYVDANTYLLDFVPQNDLSWDDYMEIMNEVADVTDVWLRAEALALNTGERCSCGRLVRFASHYVHIDDLSHQCKPCEFCMHCSVCRKELEYAGEFDGRLPFSGVRDGHEGFGETYQCENGHWFTFIQGKMIGPDRILTVLDR
jgi:hypothetical protein